MRLIDADALIEEIKNYHNSLKPRYATKLVDAEILDIIDIIRERSQFFEWIPCSEMLPNDLENVLVCFEYDKCDPLGYRIGRSQRIGVGCTFEGEWARVDGVINGWRELDVVAWQPLPQPYRE